MSQYNKYNSDVFSCEIREHTAILCPKENAFKVSLDGSYLHEFIECLNTIELDNNIKGVLILDTSDYNEVDNLKQFIDSLHKHEASYEKEKGVTRYGNAAKRLTLSLNQFSKPIVVGIQGDVPIDSFGFFMACDYRVAASDVVVKFPGMELGITPTGAVTFFLNREIGSSTTLDLFLSGDDLIAEEVLNLGMVNEVADNDSMEARCLEKLEHYYNHPELVLNMTKQLIKPKNYEIEEHFERSIRLMWNTVLNH